MSTAARVGVDTLRPFYSWIRRGLWCFDLSEQPTRLSGITAERCKVNRGFCGGVEGLLQRADFGIESMKIVDSPVEFPILLIHLQGHTLQIGRSIAAGAE